MGKRFHQNKILLLTTCFYVIILYFGRELSKQIEYNVITNHINFKYRLYLL